VTPLAGGLQAYEFDLELGTVREDAVLKPT
jgi:hypothetical protein